MVPTDRLRAGPHITLTPALPREGPQSRHLMEAEGRHRPIIRTPGPMLRPDKVRVQPLSGAAPTCRTETRAPTHNITRRQTERLRPPRGHKAERPRRQARPGGTLRPLKPPTAICTPDTMVTFTRTPVMVGRST